MPTHQTQQSPVLPTDRIMLLPQLQEMMIHQTDHVETVRNDLGVGEVLLHDTSVSL